MGLKRWRLVLPKSMILSIFLGVFAAGSGVALLAVSAWLIVRASQQPAILTLEVAIVSVRFFGLARPVGRYAERLVSHDAVLRALSNVRSRIVSALSTLSPDDSLLASRGKLLSRLVADVDRTQDLFLRIISPVITGLILTAMGSGIMAFIDPLAGALTFVILIITAGLSMLAAYHPARQANVDRSLLVASVNELVRGAEELHMWKAREHELERTVKLDKEITEKEAFSVRGFGFGSLIVFIGVGTAMAVSISIASTAFQQNQMAWASMGVLVLLPLALLDVLLPIPTAVSLLPATLSALDSTEAAVNYSTPSPHALLEPLKDPELVAGSISVSWDKRRNQVSNLSLRIPYGSKVGIIGESGSGKTTLALALCGLLTPVSGSVSINGHDLRELSDVDRSSLITFAAQDSYLFDTSIRENLLIARSDATDEEMVKVLNRVGLNDWVNRYDLGIDHIIGENGAYLSGGQRRRLIVAQGLLSRAPIKIFDEPTAHLDIDAAHALIREILAESGTVIVISHLRAPLADVERIFEMKIETRRTA